MQKLLVGALIVSGAICASAAPVDMRLRAPWHPNVLFILCDDIRWDALGYAGNPYVKTPHIDRIAREGRAIQEHVLDVFTLAENPMKSRVLLGFKAQR